MKLLNILLFLSVMNFIPFEKLKASSLDRLSVSDDYIDFGEIELGDDDSYDLTLRNESNEMLKIEEVDLWGDFFSFDYYSNCSKFLAAGESCDIEITFEPEQLGQLEAELEITIQDGEEITIFIEGIGIFED